MSASTSIRILLQLPRFKESTSFILFSLLHEQLEDHYQLPYQPTCRLPCPSTGTFKIRIPTPASWEVYVILACALTNIPYPFVRDISIHSLSFLTLKASIHHQPSINKLSNSFHTKRNLIPHQKFLIPTRTKARILVV